MKLITILTLLLTLTLHAHLTYQGTSGPGKGKHIVFIASDHEYRSEQTCPALARILAQHHGFKTTVLFGLDKNGHIKPGQSNIPGLELLKDADLMVIFTRFQDLPDAQMQHIVDYLNRGGPVVGLRTSSHAFKIPKGKKFSKYDFRSKAPNFKNGFGEQILGNTWVGHYGKNHKQGTRIQLIPSQKQNPILRGVGDNAFCYAGGYNGIAGKDFTVLANSQPMVSMKKDAVLDKSKPAVPCTWTRHYTSANGKKARVFHSTQGASEDILDKDYRRLLINGIYWAAGLEKQIKADSNIAFVGPYKPTTFKMHGYVKNVKPADLADLKPPTVPEAKAAPAKKEDAKNKKHNAPKPKRDPKLAQYYINKKSSPKPKTVAPVTTTLPLNIEPNTNIAFIGNLLLDNERRQGHLETLIHQHLPKHKLQFRNFAWPADEIDLMPRPDNFGTLDQHLLYYKTDLIIVAYGYNESFAEKDGIPAFKQRLNKFLTHLRSQAYNGKTAAQIVLLSPTPDENTKHVKAADENNANIALYTAAMKETAAKHKIAFINCFKPDSLKKVQILTEDGSKTLNLTSNGHRYNAIGHSAFARLVVQTLFSNQEPPTINENLRALVVDKATQFFHRYRPLNTFYYTGGRNKSYGYLDFLPAMRNFDLMCENRDKAIHATAAGTLTKPDDSNLPKMDNVLLARGANEFLSPEEELKAFKIDPRFEVNLFVSEKQFPEIACPIAMRWDHRGRLWVSCSTSYPHLYPGQKPADKIVILEDTDQDGKADKCTTFADDLHIPLSFTLDGKGGVYCSEQPHLTYLQDTDGDDKADTREILYTGFGCEDSHHSLHDFIWTPGGQLLFRESVFHHSQIETPYGPVRAKNSSWFAYNPSNKKLTAFGAYPNTNPWGVTFDQWGNHIASHPVFASSFHATNPPYPKQHPNPRGFQAYSGVCGHEIVDSPVWPKDLHGGYFKNRYKPTNNVEFHTWTEKKDHFVEAKQFDIIFSTNLSFIPVDLNFGPRGAMYICDWYNPVKGHAQYSLRDPRRDKKAGRIWRVLPKNATLTDPPKLKEATITELLENLKSPQIRIRAWSRRELRARNHTEVLNALNTWTVKNNKNYKALLEALWIYQGINHPKTDLARILINSDNHLIAAAALRPLRFWKDQTSPEKINTLLSQAANHPSQHVRREAAITASYIGTKEAFKAVLPVLDQPAGPHLTYAIQTSFRSAALLPFATSETNKKLTNLGKQKKSTATKLSPEDRKFDRQPNLQTLQIGCIPERIQFTKDTLTAKAGAPIKLIFKNPDATPHNIVILAKGTPTQEVGLAANEMAKDPNAAKKHYIPKDKRILHHSRLLKPHTTQTLRFTAPKTPGKYPFICTFPGHWTIMKGTLIIK